MGCSPSKANTVAATTIDTTARLQPEKASADEKAIGTTESAIASQNVVLFTKSYCPYCKAAREMLDKHSIPFKFLDLDLMGVEGKEGKAIQEYLFVKTGQNSVPFVFVKGKFLGGDEHLMELEEKGELESFCL